MSVPSQIPADVAELTVPADQGPDELVEELYARIPMLAEQVLVRFEDRLDRSIHAADRETARTKIKDRVTEDAATFLSETNEQISRLRQARRDLAAHERRPEPSARRLPDVRDKRAHAGLGLVFGIGVLVPLVFWQLLQVPMSTSGHVWTSVAIVVAGFFLMWLTSRVVVRAGRRLAGETVTDGGGWLLVLGVPTTYALSLWRLWRSSDEGMGPVLAVVVWVVVALLAWFVTWIVYSIVNEPTQTKPRSKCLAPAVVRRELLVTVVVAVLLAPALTGVIPLPWPEWVVWLSLDALLLAGTALGGPLSLSTRLAPLTLSDDVARYGSRAWEQRHDELRREQEAADQAWSAAAAAPVERSVRHHLNAVLEPPFSTVLPELERGSLGQMRAGDRVVTDTAAGIRLKSLLAGISGGAVGMAGPRGVGKSTLLEAYQAGQLLKTGGVHVALLESVPVRYDVREFTLYLYARMCAAVIDFCAGRAPTGAKPPSAWPARRARLRRLWPFAAVVVAWLGLGFAGTFALRDPKFDFRVWLTSMWWPVVSVVAVAGLAAMAARRRPGSAATPAAEHTGTAPGSLAELRTIATHRLAEIEFQQKHTAGWSGKAGLPIGVEATTTRARETTRQPRTYPEIIRGFRDFLDLTITCVAREPEVSSPAVVIILDELDKIVAPDAAQDFVNEVKALLTLDVPGFLLLVSVSEDALASFERRGLPVRDAFDSAFDVIFRVEYLKLGDARQVLTGRVLGLPEPFICLCHCLAGGLPRELIRVARQLVGDSGSLDRVTRRLVEQDLLEKRGALRTVVTRGAYDEVLVSDLVRHIDAHAVAEPAKLLHAAAHPPVAGGPTPETAALHRLQLETLGYLYYLGTVLEVFGPSFTPRSLDLGRTEGDTSFDTLTSVRQLFPVNARLAWLTISAFREAWRLETVRPPGEDDRPQTTGG
ncbi:transcriptional regulator [Amycolatopsis sp. NPDC088138]|uniref:transcriptional regulator n=1 Tax=Amycolatopsis sp. NPDC088138 TaxID=3363938 RepID=UPI003830E4C9